MKNPPSLRINVLCNKEELYSLALVCRKLLHVQFKIPSMQQELKLLKFSKPKMCYTIYTWWDHTNIILFNLRNRLLYTVLLHFTPLTDHLPSAVTLSRRLLYIEILVTHLTVNLSWPNSVLCCMHIQHGLCTHVVLHIPLGCRISSAS